MSVRTTPKAMLGPVLQAYFCSYLIGQRDLSPRTISAYRDMFRLLLRFLQKRYGIQPDALCVDDLDAPRVLAFLADLEKSRGNCARSRNARLAVLRSFFRYAAADPRLLPVAQRVRAIPMKRFDRTIVGHLSPEQMQAVLDAGDGATLVGQRDQLLLLLLYNTGARVSEIVGLRGDNVKVNGHVELRLFGRGSKERIATITRELYGRIVAEFPQDGEYLFTTRSGNPFARTYITRAIDCAARRVLGRKVTAHVLRHSRATDLIATTGKIKAVSRLLGHASESTTLRYYVKQSLSEEELTKGV